MSLIQTLQTIGPILQLIWICASIWQLYFADSEWFLPQFLLISVPVFFFHPRSAAAVQEQQTPIQQPAVQEQAPAIPVQQPTPAATIRGYIVKVLQLLYMVYWACFCWKLYFAEGGWNESQILFVSSPVILFCGADTRMCNTPTSKTPTTQVSAANPLYILKMTRYFSVLQPLLLHLVWVLHITNPQIQNVMMKHCILYGILGVTASFCLVVITMRSQFKLKTLWRPALDTLLVHVFLYWSLEVIMRNRSDVYAMREHYNSFVMTALFCLPILWLYDVAFLMQSFYVTATKKRHD